MYKKSASILPTPGLGTYPLQGELLVETILKALELGYRHIDTAQFYGNEAEVGRALAASGLRRAEVFLTTKVWHDRLAPDSLTKSVDQSLQLLDVEAVDLILIHWPSPSDQVAMEDYLSALQDVQRAGKAQHIGVSNFTIAQIDRAVEILGEGVVRANQVEVHPFLQNRRLVSYCHGLGIEVSAALPLARGRVMRDPTLARIATSHGATPAQITLAWLMARGIVPCPSSTKPENLADNLAAVDIRLLETEITEIAALECGQRLVDPDIAPSWDV